MKRAVGVVFVVFLSLVVTPVFANTIKLADSYGTDLGFGHGGEFSVTSFDGYYAQPDAKVLPSGSKFQTFCIERNEYIDFSSTFKWTLNDYANKGGVGGATNDQDPLDARTAYLFTQFSLGKLDGFNYSDSSQRANDSSALQLAIWVIEDELTSAELLTKWTTEPGKKALDWYNEATEALGGTSYLQTGGYTYSPRGIQGTWTQGIGNVRVLNLTYSNGTLAQSQLIMVPLPAAAATTLAGLGMLLAGAAIRRIRNRAA